MKLLAVSSLCELFNCKPSYIYGLVHERRIPFIKLGHRQLRFDPKQIDEWLEERTIKVDRQCLGNRRNIK